MKTRQKKNRVGEIWLDNNGNEIEIVEYIDVNHCSIKFNKGHIVENVQYSNIKNKRVKDPYEPSVFGVGYIGIGSSLVSFNGKHTKKYLTWKGILERCYSGYRSRPTYNGCTICDEWKDFQVFGDWFDNNYNPLLMKDWHLDKDIIIPGNKIYRPYACAFVPQEINALFKPNSIANSIYGDGVYKRKNRFVAQLGVNGKRVHIGSFTTKEDATDAYCINKINRAKEVAEIWKGKIDPKVYLSIINYKI